MTDEQLLDFDFIEEVKQTKIEITKTEEKFSKDNKKVNNLVDRLNAISTNFDIVIDTSEELSTEVEKDIAIIKTNKDICTITPSDMFQLDILYEDFTNIRKTLNETVKNGKSVLDSITNELIMNPGDAELVMSYSQLMNVVNSSMKLLASTYKDISEIILRIKKFEDAKPKEANVTNIQNNFYAESTADIIKQLRK